MFSRQNFELRVLCVVPNKIGLGQLEILDQVCPELMSMQRRKLSIKYSLKLTNRNVVENLCFLPFALDLCGIT